MDNALEASYHSNHLTINAETQNVLFYRHQAATLTGSYDLPIDAIRQPRNIKESVYCDPPSEETELKKQVKKLEVKKERIT